MYIKHIALKGHGVCDLSANNIFISDAKTPLVKFIDADNIEYQSCITSSIYTPNYDIPEIDKGGKNSMYSDIYAFGILAFYLLSMVYPFVKSESDWDNEEAKSKKIWEEDWIESENFGGECKEGLRGILSTEPLRALFSATFEEGKLKPYNRPIMPLWINAIEKALNDTLICPKCEMSYYDSLVLACPYCEEAKPLRVVVKSNKRKFVRELVSSVDVPLSLLYPTSSNKNTQELLFSIQKVKDNVILKKQYDKELKISNKSIFSQYKRPLSEFNNMEIHIDTHTLILRIEQ